MICGEITLSHREQRFQRGDAFADALAEAAGRALGLGGGQKELDFVDDLLGGGAQGGGRGLALAEQVAGENLAGASQLGVAGAARLVDHVLAGGAHVGADAVVDLAGHRRRCRDG